MNSQILFSARSRSRFVRDLASVPAVRVSSPRPFVDPSGACCRKPTIPIFYLSAKRQRAPCQQSIVRQHAPSLASFLGKTLWVVSCKRPAPANWPSSYGNVRLELPFPGLPTVLSPWLAWIVLDISFATPTNIHLVLSFVSSPPTQMRHMLLRVDMSVSANATPSLGPHFEGLKLAARGRNP